MSTKKPTYEDLRHELDTKLIQASSLPTKPEQQVFVNCAFMDIHTAYTEKHVNHAEYVKLVNRLAAYQQGAYNDYLDTLTGAAAMGMLNLAIRGEIAQLSPEASEQRRQLITDLTGVQPAQPGKEE